MTSAPDPGAAGDNENATTTSTAASNTVAMLHERKMEHEQSAGIPIASSSPVVKITLRPYRFLALVLVLCVLIAVFTVVAAHGIVLQHVYDAVGSSKVADDRTEMYNTWSGLVLALVEVLVGGHMEVFMPVFNVYLHNALWKLGAVINRLVARCWTKKSESVADLSDKSSSALPPSPMPIMRSIGLFLFPVIIALTFGNSLRSLQASNSTVGFKSIIIDADLSKDQSELDRLVKRAETKIGDVDSSTYSTILQNAIRQRATPFQFASDSKCTQKNATEVAAGERTVPINVHDLDTSSVVYGFTLRDWNAEALSTALSPKQSVAITYTDAMNNNTRNASTGAAIATLTEDMLMTTFEMLFHGTIMIEKAVGDATNQNHSCELSDHNRTYGAGSRSSSSGSRRRRRRLTSDDEEDDDASSGDVYMYEGDDSYNQWTVDENNTRICQGPVSYLFDLLESPAAEQPTVANLMTEIVKVLNTSFPGVFALTETIMTIESYNLTSQISLDVLQIDAIVDSSLEYGVSECTLSGADQSTCDVSNYVYSDWSSAFCGDYNCVFLDASNNLTLQKEIGLVPLMLECEDIRYSGDYHGFYPVTCTKSTNSTFLYGIGSHITGDTFGSNDTETGLPFIKTPRRHVTFSFGIMSWELEDLATKFGAECEAPGECHGLWFKLESSSRFLFAGKSALPTSRIMRADYHSPIQLVQLNSPSIYVSAWNMSLDLERLNPNDFTKTLWDDDLSGEDCSMLMASYIDQVDENRYFLDHPLHPMYVSAFFYLMANAAVTDVTNSTTVKANDALGVAALKGDQQLREVKIVMPLASFKISAAGCCFLVAAMIVILALPRRYCVEHFETDTSTADKYLAMRREEEYSDKLYRKVVVIGDTRVPTKDLEVTTMTLRAAHPTKEQQTTQTDKLQL
jgi:hypothetical protein